MQRLIAYERVSTAGQGASGLGLAAQRTAINAFARSRDAEVAARFTEMESGHNLGPPVRWAVLPALKIEPVANVGGDHARMQGQQDEPGIQTVAGVNCMAQAFLGTPGRKGAVAGHEFLAALDAIAQQLDRVVIGGFGRAGADRCLGFEQPDGCKLHGFRHDLGMQPGFPQRVVHRLQLR